MASSSWFITGASRGFGRELTEQLLARGDRVAATARRPEQLDDLAERHGSERLWRHALDVTDTARVQEVVAAAWAALGRIDVVVSNAGYGVIGAAEELTDAQVEGLIATNLVASIQLARAVVPHLRDQGGGRILQVSSMGGQMAFPGFSLYHASKWGIEGFFEAFTHEVEPFGIRTTLVEPGMIRTSFYDVVQRAAPLCAYDDHPAIPRTPIPVAAMPGDPGKVVAAMIALGDADDPPRRALMGSDAYALVHASVGARLAEVEAQAATAPTTDG
jgi:NAD(P)-dependent dehydrogenase (short-subunit alcohol dehydrogenase family)